MNGHIVLVAFLIFSTFAVKAENLDTNNKIDFGLGASKSFFSLVPSGDSVVKWRDLHSVNFYSRYERKIDYGVSFDMLFDAGYIYSGELTDDDISNYKLFSTIELCLNIANNCGSYNVSKSLTGSFYNVSFNANTKITALENSNIWFIIGVKNHFMNLIPKGSYQIISLGIPVALDGITAIDGVNETDDIGQRLSANLIALNLGLQFGNDSFALKTILVLPFYYQVKLYDWGSGAPGLDSELTARNSLKGSIGFDIEFSSTKEWDDSMNIKYYSYFNYIKLGNIKQMRRGTESTAKSITYYKFGAGIAFQFNF